jgi:plasmid maintenance system antidote protein VapI
MIKKETQRTVNNILLEAIKESPLSLREIARQIGVTHACLSHYTNGKRGISLNVADNLIVLFGFELRKKGRK